MNKLIPFLIFEKVCGYIFILKIIIKILIIVFFFFQIYLIILFNISIKFNKYFSLILIFSSCITFQTLNYFQFYKIWNFKSIKILWLFFI